MFKLLERADTPRDVAVLCNHIAGMSRMDRLGVYLSIKACGREVGRPIKVKRRWYEEEINPEQAYFSFFLYEPVRLRQIDFGSGERVYLIVENPDPDPREPHLIFFCDYPECQDEGFIEALEVWKKVTPPTKTKIKVNIEEFFYRPEICISS